ncbi:MAG TPA: DUF1573 domain-containing protein [Kofleriaceae bacterium]|nr:DUF1573 domain-containing protein [Kofleriaceae bacterium]
MKVPLWDPGPARTGPPCIGMVAALVMALAACGDNLAPLDDDDPGDPSDPDDPDPPDEPEDLQPGAFLSPLVQLQRLQGEEDHLHVDEVRLRDDDLLFQCSYTFGVVDATDAQAMQYLSQNLNHVVPGDEREPGCLHVAWDDTAYNIVYTTHRGNIRNPAFLSGWDITDPEVPVQIPVLQEPGISYEGVDVANGNVFVGLKQDGLGVYQRDAGNNLTRVGTAGGFESAWGVFARPDGIVFVADSLGGLVTVDATDPTSPVIVGQVATGGQARGVVVDGDIAYVAAGSGGVAVVDVADLARPVVIGRATMPGSAIRVAYSEGRLFVAAWNDARVYDVSVPASPRFVAAVRVPQPDDDIVDADRPDSTSRIFGIAARGKDVFLGSWWVLHSYRLYPERVAPNIRLPETFMLTDFGRVAAGGEETLPFEVVNQGTAPLTLVNNWVSGSAFTVEPRQLRLEPGESSNLSLTYKPSAGATETGYLQILSDDPQAPLRTAYLVGNQEGLGVGDPMPETRGVLLDGAPWSSSLTDGKVLLLAYFATF